MDERILKEIKSIRLLLSKMLGTSELSAKDRFSIKALDNAADLFKTLSIERNEWISGSDISKIIRKAPYYADKFIIEHFGFKDYFKRGRSLYFNRKSILALNRELKLRNIDLKRYMEYLEDKSEFDKFIKSVKANKGKKRGPHFSIPAGLENILTTPPPAPSLDLISNHLDRLKEKFETNNYSKYIDIYHGNYAMVKVEFLWNHYMDSGIKRSIRKWSQEFNYANEAKKILEKGSL